MKRSTLGISIFFIAMVSFMPLTKAQKKPFTGTIVYDVKSDEYATEQANGALPTEMTMKVSPEKLSQVWHSSVVDIKTIISASSQTVSVLMDMLGQKQYNKGTAAEIADYNKKKGIVFTVKLTSDIKTIAGYNCKRAIVTTKSDQTVEQTIDVYFTDEIDVSKFYFGNAFPEVGGLPLEFSTKRGNSTLKTTAKSVKKGNIDETEFSIPEDYKLVTM